MVEITEAEETQPLISQKQDSPTTTKRVTTKVPEITIHLYKSGKGPIDIFTSSLGGWERDQLEVGDILDKYGLKSLYAFNKSWCQEWKELALHQIKLFTEYTGVSIELDPITPKDIPQTIAGNFLMRLTRTDKQSIINATLQSFQPQDGKLKDLQDIAHVILYIVSKGVHLLKDVVAVNPGLVDEKDLMKLVGTNAEVIDLLKKIGIVQLQTAQPSIYRITTIEDLMMQPFFWDAPRRLDFFTDLSNHLAEGNPTTALQTDIEAIIYDVVDSKSVLYNGRPSWHSKFTTLKKAMSNILKNNKKAGWKYPDGEISSLIRLVRNERSHYEETRANAAITSKAIHVDFIVKGRELGTCDTEMEQKFRAKFPKLLTKLHDAARTYPIDILKKYYH
ncbi:serine/threonine-protein kinase/endoribonuclease IRE1 [Tanacetum coccineum]